MLLYDNSINSNIITNPSPIKKWLDFNILVETRQGMALSLPAIDINCRSLS